MSLFIYFHLNCPCYYQLSRVLVCPKHNVCNLLVVNCERCECISKEVTDFTAEPHTHTFKPFKQ